MVHDKFLRVLFITPHAFNHVNGGGITFSNLFSGWPKDCLATVHNDPEPVSYDVCDQYYSLDIKEIDLAFPFNYLRRFSSSTKKSKKNDNFSPVEGKPSFLRKLFITIVGERIPEHGKLSPELEKWIEDYKPDVIYTILGSSGMMNLIEDVRVHFELPLVVHVMDDWINVRGKGLLGPVQMFYLRKQARHFFNVASVCMGISPHMCEEYNRRYGVKFYSFQNVIDVKKIEAFKKNNLAVSTPANIVYIGSIFSNAQLDSLIDCCKAVANLNLEGHKINMTISSPSDHASRYHDKLAVHSSINIIKTIEDDDEFFSTIANADLLLLPVNFDDESIRFIRYSMPTKVPAYLSIGTPILVYGPDSVAQVSYAKKSGWGIMQSERNIKKLGEVIMKGLTDVHLREKVSNSAINSAYKHHDSINVKEKFQKYFQVLS
jgi:glycosyltransferase involved in cell wall biosynthesis